MGLVSRPDLGNDGAENGTVPQLESAFQPADFDNVQNIHSTPEEEMKREIGNWKKQYELMEKKYSEIRLSKLEAENELNNHKRECGVLREQVIRLERDLKVQIARSEEDQKVQITRNNEDLRVHSDREKTWEERYAKLLNDYTKIETENKKLNIRVSELGIGRNKADRELTVYKKKFQELNLRVSRLESDTDVLMSEVENRKADLVGAEKNSESGKSQQCGTSFGTGDAHVQEKESTSEQDEVGCASGCMEAATGSNVQEEAAMLVGTGDANLQEKESTSKRDEVGPASDSMEARSNRKEAGPDSVMACSNGKPIQNQLAVERGISNKRTGSNFVIEVSDSEDDNPKVDESTSMPNYASSYKGIKSEHSGPTSVGNRKSGVVENCLLDSIIKRKRECENGDDGGMTSSKRRTKSLQELILEGIDVSDSSDSEDSSSSDSDVERAIERFRKAK